MKTRTAGWWVIPLFLLFITACTPATIPVSPDATAALPDPTGVAPDPEEQPSPEATEPSNAPLPPDAPGPKDNPASLTPNEVTVTLNQASFGVDEILEVTVANGLDQVIYTNNLKSDCGIFILEKKVEENWTPLLACGMEMLPISIAIDSGAGYQFNIDPASTHFAPLPVDAGTYRVRFTYRFEQSPDMPENEFAVSVTFPIGP